MPIPRVRPPNAQGFSRREREITFERAEFFAREADGCKPLLRILNLLDANLTDFTFLQEWQQLQ